MLPDWLDTFTRRRLEAPTQRRTASIRAPGDGEGDRRVAFITSSEGTDRYGDIIRQAGWEFGAYRATNRPFLFGHGFANESVTTIGKGVSEEVIQSFQGVTGPALRQVFEFAPEGASALADTAFRLVDAGIMTSTSVGFRPLKIEFIQDEDERRRLGLGPMGVVFARQELMETSLVDVPANPEVTIVNAFGDAVRRSIITPDDVAIMSATGQLPVALQSVWREEKGTTYLSMPEGWGELFREPEPKTKAVREADRDMIVAGIAGAISTLSELLDSLEDSDGDDGGDADTLGSTSPTSRAADSDDSGDDWYSNFLDVVMEGDNESH